MKTQEENNSPKPQNSIWRAGFTLIEMLLVVGIIVALSAITVPNFVEAQRSAKRIELDAKAETIYMAVQNRLTRMAAMGQQTSLFTGEESEVAVLFEDGEEDTKKAWIASFAVSDAANAIMDAQANVLSPELMNGYWIVEYLPETATVTGVFYCDQVKIADGIAITDYKGLGDFDGLKTKEGREAVNALIGYHDTEQEGISPGRVLSLSPRLEILDGAELIARVTCTVPKGQQVSDTFVRMLQTDFTVTDESGAQKFEFKYVAFKEKKQSVQDEIGKKEYYCDLILDSLAGETADTVTASTKCRFQTKFTSGTKQITPGKNLCISATVQCTDARYRYQENTNDAVCNSLFYYDSERLLTDENTAYIKNGRHLQNLDSSSGVTSTITKAKQLCNVFFCDMEGQNWLAAYSGFDEDAKAYRTYFHGNNGLGGTPEFKPICNDYLESYDGSHNGQYYEIYKLYVDETSKAGYNAGLFGVIKLTKDKRIENVKLTGAKIRSFGSGGVGYTGGIVGMVESTGGSLTISYCQIYLTADDDYGNYFVRNNTTNSDDRFPKGIRYLQGQNCGGIIGAINTTSQITLESCAVATGMGNDSAAVVGGLVGCLMSSANKLTIRNSYASCYMMASTEYSNIGGLIGYASNKSAAQADVVVLEGCYAAGYVVQGSMVAGLGRCYLKYAENCYTILDRVEQGIAAENKILTNSVARDIADAKNVGYLIPGAEDTDKALEKTESFGGLNRDEINVKYVGEGFISPDAQEKQQTKAYKLYDSGRGETYPYAQFSSIPHFGDWTLLKTVDVSAPTTKSFIIWLHDDYDNETPIKIVERNDEYVVKEWKANYNSCNGAAGGYWVDDSIGWYSAEDEEEKKMIISTDGKIIRPDLIEPEMVLIADWLGGD